MTDDEIDALRKELRERGLCYGFSGLDGSGKSTMVEKLENNLRSAGLPVRRYNLFRWYRSLFVTPYLVLRNRYWDRNILLLDRGFLDNLAVFSVRFPALKSPMVLLARVITLCVPTFNGWFYMYTSLEETIDRRPGTVPDHYRAMLDTYKHLFEGTLVLEVRSDENAYDLVLAHLIDHLQFSKPDKEN